MSKFSFQFLSPLILFFLILIDGQITGAISTLTSGHLVFVSHLVLIFLVYTVTQHKYFYVVVLAIFLGLIYDSYYQGIYGVASLLLPLAALFVYHIRSLVFTNRWTRLFTMIIIVSVFEVLSGIIMAAFGFAEINLFNFVAKQLAPTLFLNIILMIVLQIPLEKMYKLQKTALGYTRK